MNNRILTIESEEDLKVLRKISEPIESVEKEQELITSLKAHFGEGNTSLGIAAPQIGVNKMAFAMVNPRNIEEITVCINPEIIKMYPNKIGFFSESCLSIPETKSLTRRYKMLKVAYINENGQKVKKLLKDLEAVVFQHELDHLFGCLMIDKDIKRKSESEEI
jgi:peptide deformylase